MGKKSTHTQAENDRLFTKAMNGMASGDYHNAKEACLALGLNPNAFYTRKKKETYLPVPVSGKRRHRDVSQPRLVTLPTAHESPALSDGGQVTAMIVKVPASFIRGLFE